MNEDLSERLMTVEEAERLSGLRPGEVRRKNPRTLWAWQSVAGALAQCISDEQIERMARLMQQEARSRER